MTLRYVGVLVILAALAIIDTVILREAVIAKKSDAQYEAESEKRTADIRVLQNYLLVFNLFILLISAMTVFRPLVEKINLFIAAQRQAERALRRQTSVQQMLHAITAHANKSRDERQSFASCLAEVCAFTGWPIGHIYLVDRKQSKPLVSSDIWHISIAWATKRSPRATPRRR
jgi:hypothetical protein